MNNYIWLFGENLATTANNNSFYFWKETVKKNDGIEKYIVFEYNKQNKSVYKTLDSTEKKFVVWKNSLKHYKIFFNADMYYVSLSYKDITPSKFLFLDRNYFIEKPLIYLQHGTLGIKQIGYTGTDYNNNMFRFIYYNKNIKDQFQACNNFKDYQLYYGIYPPRYKELLKRHRKYNQNSGQAKQILWFLTWREYLGKDYKTDILLYHIDSFLTNEKLNAWLEKTNSVLTVCLHQFFDETKLAKIKQKLKTDKIKFAYTSDTDVLEELARNDILITDYSSVGFDFTFLNKPVIFFQPDLEAYLGERKLYCDLEELKSLSYYKGSDLADCIISEKYSINPFFASRLPDKIDYDFVEQGQHIIRMYNDFAEIQKNKVSFIGYNFYGVGGTVFATRSLAEALLEKNYLVELISLRSNAKPKGMPFGLQLTPLYDSKSRRKKEILKRNCLPKIKKLYGYLNYDYSKETLLPYANFGLKNKLRKIRSKTVISTRESLHLYLNDAVSDKIANKIYFFHTTSKLVDSIFPGVMDKIKSFNIGKAVFVTEESLIGYKNDLNYSNYSKSLVLGNTLESSRSISKEEIATLETPEHDGFKGMYLVRVSKERIKDIDNLIGFGKYLKKNNINDICIDVYGTGDYVYEFLERIFENNLENHICYRGLAKNPKNNLVDYDAVVDFSLNHSFGMPYIEAILNGKMVYCTDNYGSRDVLKDIKGCIYSDYADLVNKIEHFSSITKEDLLNNYEIIAKKYSRSVLADKFIEFMHC